MKKEKLKEFIQSANINFLVGSGLSVPYLRVLGNIENELSKKNLTEEGKRKNYKEYFNGVMLPNSKSEITKKQDEYSKVKQSYIDFLTLWNEIIAIRGNKLLSKQVNIFTTNIDTFFENATEESNVEFNDGFKGSVKQYFDEGNFQKSILKTSLHFQNKTELPVFNLLKMHGSINWKAENDKIVNDYNLDLVNSIAQNLDKDDFITEYEKLVIVNPTKSKFSESVLDLHFYDLMRLYSNSLEKENSLLFVMGFSFADEHIRTITQRAIRTNPTLMVVIFAYEEKDIASYKEYFTENNVVVLSPTEFNVAESKFTFDNINSVYRSIYELIPINFNFQEVKKEENEKQ